MKRYLLIAAIALISTNTFAQYTAQYCDLQVYQPGLKNYEAAINYGDVRNSKTLVIQDSLGNTMKFINEVAAVNYMAQRGWTLVTSYHERGGDTHFFMKKAE